MSENDPITVYYNVAPPGTPDTFHTSEHCAGNYTKETDAASAFEAGAEPCGTCVPNNRP